MTSSRTWLLPGLLPLLLASGCGLQQWVENGFKVGPNYGRPPAPVASEWIDYENPRVKSEEADLSHWWQALQDPVLDSLIQTASQQNISLRVAGARILAAQAERGIAVGFLFPQFQSAFGSYTRIKLSDKVANPPRELWFDNWRNGLTASWEIDFWGRYRRAIEAADAELDSSVENYDDVLVVLLGDVAASYIEYRTFEQRLVYARENVEIQTKSYGVAQDRFKNGATTERDVQQAKQVLEETRALIPQFEIGKRVAGNRLCILMGMPPVDLEPILGKAGAIPATPAEVFVGIPADLLRRRPDVRRAERQVAAQSARIGIATADFYPRFAISGTIGLNAEHFGNLFKTPGSMFGSIGPSFVWDILNYGRILNSVRVQDARFQGLAFLYQESVLNAAREVEDALVAFLRTREQEASLKASADAAQRTVEIVSEQYKQGAVDFTAVFVAQSALAQAQDQLAAVRGEMALSVVRVYRAVGGGWEMRLQSGSGAAHAMPPVMMPPAELPPPPREKNMVRQSSMESTLVNRANSATRMPSAVSAAPPQTVISPAPMNTPAGSGRSAPRGVDDGPALQAPRPVLGTPVLRGFEAASE